jgi:hypothetical protein
MPLGKTLMRIREQQKTEKCVCGACMFESSQRSAETHLQLCSTWNAKAVPQYL